VAPGFLLQRATVKPSASEDAPCAAGKSTSRFRG
jgi:hypothetical protein